MQAHNKFEILIQQVLAAQGYSEDVQRTSYDDLMDDDSLPGELRKFMVSTANVWQYLIDNEIELPKPDHVFSSSNLFVTPKDANFLSEFMKGVPANEHANVFMAVQMTINYINSKGE